MTVAWLAGAGLVLLIGLWAVQVRTRDAATADVGWTVLVGAGGIAAAALVRDADPVARWIVAALVALWALRLAAHLIRDRVLRPGRGEDGRYRALRERWGEKAPRYFLLLYLLQAPMAALFLVPLVAAMRHGAADGWAAAGVVVWALALAGESIADAQLARFRADPRNRGRVCDAGLWKTSRHPNYFFEWLHWFAYVLIGHGAALTWLGPALMLLFLFRLTGIPHTERQSLRTRGDAYREYQRKTSLFIPWPPRREPRR
jgi:steroid 5-alpha reductase family enzyme